MQLNKAVVFVCVYMKAVAKSMILGLKGNIGFTLYLHLDMLAWYYAK